MAVAVEHDHGVEAAVEGVLVAEFLVAAVAAVGAVAKDQQLAVGVGIGEGLAGGFIQTAVVHDIDDFDFAPDVVGDAVEGIRDEAFGVVGNDKDAEAFSVGAKRLAAGGGGGWVGGRRSDG